MEIREKLRVYIEKNKEDFLVDKIKKRAEIGKKLLEQEFWDKLPND